jgi:hypothetical protein
MSCFNMTVWYFFFFLLLLGDHVGLKGVVDNITLEKSVRALIGMNRHEFLQKVLGNYHFIIHF